MHRTVLIALAATGLAAAASPAPYGARAGSPEESLPAGACVRPADIVNRTIDPAGQAFYFLVHNRGTYRLTPSGDCLQGASRHDGIVLRRLPDRSTLCRPNEFQVTVGGPGHSRRCFIESVELLTPAQAEALPKAVRP